MSELSELKDLIKPDIEHGPGFFVTPEVVAGLGFILKYVQDDGVTLENVRTIAKLVQANYEKNPPVCVHSAQSIAK